MEPARKGHSFSLIVWVPEQMESSRRPTTDSNRVWSTLDVPPSLLRLAGIGRASSAFDPGEEVILATRRPEVVARVNVAVITWYSQQVGESIVRPRMQWSAS